MPREMRRLKSFFLVNELDFKFRSSNSIFKSNLRIALPTVRFASLDFIGFPSVSKQAFRVKLCSIQLKDPCLALLEDVLYVYFFFGLNNNGNSNAQPPSTSIRPPTGSAPHLSCDRKCEADCSGSSGIVLIL